MIQTEAISSSNAGFSRKIKRLEGGQVKVSPTYVDLPFMRLAKLGLLEDNL